jgi:SAM-dependent methyltransferase
MGYRSAGTPNDAPAGPRVDWSVGHYEQTAPQLLAAAELLVEEAAPLAGARVVDVGCGTGNAALLAAARGARVTGVDPALRLLQVASRRAAAAALKVTFLAGEAAALPLPDNSADVVLSVFGVIFAPDPQAAAAELARVTADDGRILLTAWIPDGPIAQMNHVAQQAVLRALGAPAAPPPFAWHDSDALNQLFAPHGFSLTLTEHRRPDLHAPARDPRSRQRRPHRLPRDQPLHHRGSLQRRRPPLSATESPTSPAATAAAVQVSDSLRRQRWWALTRLGR